MGSDSVDLVDEVLDAVDTVFAESSFDDGVIGEGKATVVNFTGTSLVDETLDGGPGRVTIGHEGLNHSDHVDGGSVELHEHSVVELTETQQLHDFLGLGSELVDTKTDKVSV